MRSHIAIMVRSKTEFDPLWFYLPGQWLLQETANAVGTWDAQSGGVPPTMGTDSVPLPLRTPGQWRSAYVSMRGFRNSAYIFNVSGRKIKKWANGNSGGHADGFYMSDVALSGTDPVGTGESNRIWTRDNGASYREFAKFMAQCMPGDSAVAWSEDIARRMRIVMGGGVNLSAQPGTSIYSALPLLAAVMFIAEPARNKRAWPAGLMMLDLVGQQYNVYKTGAKYYTWDKILAHPERIDPGFVGSAPLDKPQRGPTGRASGKYGAPVGLAPLAKKSQLASVEGKLPASPSGSASTSQVIDVANDYIQMKELSLVVRWLQRQLHAAHQDEMDLAFVTWRDSDPLTGLTNLTSDAALRDMITRSPAKEIGVTLPILKEFQAGVQKEIRDLLQKRCQTFDAM